MGEISKWCPMCGAAPGEPCTTISGDEAGQPRAWPHFYRHNDHPIPVAIKDEPAEYRFV